MLNMATPTVLNLPRRSDRPAKLGRYPSSRMAARTRSLVSGRTLGESCTVRETVCSETPARRATSLTETDFLTAAIGRSFYVNDAIGGILRSQMNAFKYIQRLPAIRLPPKTYRSPTIPLPRTAFVAQMLTLPLRKHRATGRLKRLRVRNRWFAGIGTTGSRLFLCRKMATSTFWQPNANSYHRC